MISVERPGGDFSGASVPGRRSGKRQSPRRSFRGPVASSHGDDSDTDGVRGRYHPGYTEDELMSAPNGVGSAVRRRGDAEFARRRGRLSFISARLEVVGGSLPRRWHRQRWTGARPFVVTLQG